mmetsp:Transcript_6730/g.14740  ORF Transcript_6730/g.14740 Transcript_6730/m.14740 type:complete len:212 (-) Transcript_6730:1144-1779(-)
MVASNNSSCTIKFNLGISDSCMQPLKTSVSFETQSQASVKCHPFLPMFCGCCALSLQKSLTRERAAWKTHSGLRSAPAMYVSLVALSFDIWIVPCLPSEGYPEYPSSASSASSTSRIRCWLRRCTRSGSFSLTLETCVTLVGFGLLDDRSNWRTARTSRSMSTRAPDAPLRVDEVSTGDMKSKTSRIVVAKSRSMSSNLAVNTCAWLRVAV